MKNLLVYYSKTNKTKYLSNIFFEILKKENDFSEFQILEKNNGLRYGISGLFFDLYNIITKKSIELKKNPDFENTEKIIFFSPIWAGNLALPIKHLINKYNEVLSNKKIFIITTSQREYKKIDINLENYEFYNFKRLNNNIKDIKAKEFNNINYIIEKIKK